MSANQASRLGQELNEYKDRMNDNNRENEEIKKRLNKLYQENAFLND
jgi:hypothetical protein